MRNRLRILLISALLALGAGGARASTSNNTYVTSVMVLGGIAVFHDSGTRSAQPACSTLNRWAFDATTPAGQAMLSSLLSAYVAHIPIWIVGTGACEVYNNSETASYFWLGAQGQ